MSSWNTPTFSDEGAPRSDGSIKGERKVEPIECPDHFLNWVQCIRNNKTPIAPIEAGYQHAVAVLMAMKSYETGKKTFYDHETRKILTT